MTTTIPLTLTFYHFQNELVVIKNTEQLNQVLPLYVNINNLKLHDYSSPST